MAELEQRCNDGAEALTNQQGQLDGQDAHYQGLLEAGAAAFSVLEAQKDTLEQAKATLQSELDTLKEHQSGSAGEVAGLRDELATATAAADMLNATIAECEHELHTVRAELQQKTAEAEAAAGDRVRLQSESFELSERLSGEHNALAEEKAQQIAELERKLAEQDASHADIL